MKQIKYNKKNVQASIQETSNIVFQHRLMFFLCYFKKNVQAFLAIVGTIFVKVELKYCHFNVK